MIPYIERKIPYRTESVHFFVFMDPAARFYRGMFYRSNTGLWSNTGLLFRNLI